ASRDSRPTQVSVLSSAPNWGFQTASCGCHVAARTLPTSSATWSRHSDPARAMIRFHKVSKQYPTSGGAALEDITFHVGRGEFVFLTGHSGAGKSTVLKLMYAEERPTGGDVRVSGFAVPRLRRDEVPRLRRRLGIVFQELRLMEDRTAGENVALGLEVSGARSDVIPASGARVSS